MRTSDRILIWTCVSAEITESIPEFDARCEEKAHLCKNGNDMARQPPGQHVELGVQELQVTSIVLVSAVLASLAAGVLLAYGLCVAMFLIFRMHARQVREMRVVARQAGAVQS